MRIVISSGHGFYVKGASGLMDEVTEARRVVARVVEYMEQCGAEVDKFHEDLAKNDKDNINNTIAYHNRQTRDLDLSIHFNATKEGIIRDGGIGVETCYFMGNQTTRSLASKVSRAISQASGLTLRRIDGTFAKGTEVGFLARTTAPAILIEVCFVDSRTDVRLYRENFDRICQVIAETITGIKVPQVTPPQPEHWAAPLLNELRGTGITITDKRYRDALLRGESFAVFLQIMQRVVAIEKEFAELKNFLAH